MSSSLIYYSQTAELFEGPIFDKEYSLLYFVSIFDNLVYCYDPSTKEILSIKLDSPTSCIYILDNKKVLVASKDGFFEVNFKTLSSTFTFQIDIDPLVRYNDGIKDPVGRIIIGTMGYPEIKDNVGKVYSYNNDNYKVIIENTTISNGLAFTADQNWLYFIDTPTKKVAKYAYDIETGDMIFDSYVIELTGNGSPDGMTIDDNGMLWIAEWGGACVSQWDPSTGKEINKIKLPYNNVTSCCFDKQNNLYITTAKSESATGINNGSGLFYVELKNI
ncbi:SMP-30/gluconolactonase/LRE family protein [Winogradskyella sp. PE311]|uniref:SMP-30/gluconolactonase/LRE family protein n=1 Tax=Winogradskyella sp. PE311 TaxID=3366943 RepID=UPI00397F15BA